MRVADFDFDLPDELIAQFPPAVRGGSRLLHVEAAGALHDRWFSELPTLLRPNDLLVMNDTRVIKARLFGTKDSGGKVELLVERITGEFEALAFIRASHAPKAGSRIHLSADISLEVLARQDRPDAAALSAPGARRAGSTRPAAAAALYRTHADCGRRGTLPDGVCERTRRGGGADGRPAFRRRDAGWLLKAGHPHGAGDAARRRGHLPAGAGGDIAEHKMHSERYTIPQATVDAIVKRARAAAAWWRWAPPACVHWRPPQQWERCTQAPARPTFSSRRAIASRWSTRSSPTSTCPSPRC
jgi:S-adenosylmethionine:tRNA ribosyltransferase-isomerase